MHWTAGSRAPTFACSRTVREHRGGRHHVGPGTPHPRLPFRPHVSGPGARGARRRRNGRFDPCGRRGDARHSGARGNAHGPSLARSNDTQHVWTPGMAIMPHDHRMWSVIGIYGGREDNLFWRRVPHDRHGRIEPTDARTLSQGETAVLAADVIHSVRNPASGFTAAIHVYGGDFFGARRASGISLTLGAPIRCRARQAALRACDLVSWSTRSGPGRQLIGDVMDASLPRREVE